MNSSFFLFCREVINAFQRYLTLLIKLKGPVCNTGKKFMSIFFSGETMQGRGWSRGAEGGKEERRAGRGRGDWEEIQASEVNV